MGRLFAHVAHLAGINGALHDLQISVHAVPERGAILVDIQLLLAVSAVVALAGAMAPAIITAFVYADVGRLLIVVCSAATIPYDAVVSIPIVGIVVVSTIVVVVMIVVVVVSTVGVLHLIIIAAVVAIIPLLLMLLVVYVAHHVSHLLLEASICLLHLLLGMCQPCND